MSQNTAAASSASKPRSRAPQQQTTPRQTTPRRGKPRRRRPDAASGAGYENDLPFQFMSHEVFSSIGVQEGCGTPP